jgi:hypothetical protein
MPLILYPVILILAVIVFYILGKYSTPAKEITKTVEVVKTDLHLYDEETAESYELRCQNFIVSLIEEIGVPYTVAPDHSYYQVNLIGFEDYHNQITIWPYYADGDKYITFETRLTATTIPNDKLPLLAELINRLNSELMICGLSLDYSNRAILYKTQYKVGNHELVADYFWFNLKSVNNAARFIPYCNRIIQENEEPVLVALDFLSR